MAQDTNLSRETPYDGPQGNVPELSSAGRQRKQGIRTHVLLVLVMALVTMIVTGVSLFLVRNQLRREVTDHLSEDLNRSVTGFEDMEAERLAALDRENALLADLPTLKALMTSGDDITIQDEAVEFWEISGDDLFALADPRGRIVAAYTKGSSTPAALDQELQTLLASPQRHYLIDGRSLYACSLRPLYFGSEEHGTLLGYVISGTSIERTVRQIGQPNGLEAGIPERWKDCSQHPLSRHTGESGGAGFFLRRAADADSRHSRQEPFFGRNRRPLSYCNCAAALDCAQVVRTGRAVDQPH